jgi:pilus assembly protein Flp/PilA
MRHIEMSGWWRLGLRPARIFGLYIKTPAVAGFLRDEGGQDLIEYAVVVALISLAATVSMRSVATAIGTAFTHIGSHVATYTS